MSIATEITQIVQSVLTPEIDALALKLDSILAVQVDVNSRQRAMESKVDQILALLPQIVAAPVIDQPVITPPGYPPVVNPPVALPEGAVSWRGSTWTIVGGQIMRDGAVTAETAKTAGATAIGVGMDGLLWHVAGGRKWVWSGLPDWTAAPPDVTISAAAPTISGSAQVA